MYLRLTFFLGLALGACSPSQKGAITPEGYKHSTYDYAVQPMAGTAALLPDAWTLDNLYTDAETGKLTSKNTAEYTTEYRFDLNGDDKFDTTNTEFTYDLRYLHRVQSGVIWLRNVPTSQRDRDRSLRVLMQDYIDQIAGGSYELVVFDEEPRIEEKRYATEVLARGEGSLAGKPAYAAEFAVANVDQIQVAGNARRERVKVVIVRPGFEYPVANPNGYDDMGFPTLLIAGFASQPEDYAAGVKDFDEFLARVRLDGQTGLSLEPQPEGDTKPDANVQATQ